MAVRVQMTMVSAKTSKMPNIPCLTGLRVSSIFTAVALCSFAFSTIIGWGLYGSRCIEFLFHTDKVVGPFLVVYSFVSILGATVDLGLLWSIADTFNGLMSIPNLMALLLLSGTVAKFTKEFFAGEGAGK